MLVEAVVWLGSVWVWCGGCVGGGVCVVMCVCVVKNNTYGGIPHEAINYAYHLNKDKNIHGMCLFLNLHLNIWDCWARLGYSPVISERLYNLEVDLLLKLVGKGACNMFSIHKYWLWLSSRPALTLVGFHFGTNLYEIHPIPPQSLSRIMCALSCVTK